MESPQCWFEDFGSAQLKGGSTRVRLEPGFAQTVKTREPYHVFTTPLGDCNGLYVTDLSSDGFTVRELVGGTSDVGFSYRIVALRRGVDAPRLKPVPPPPARQAPERRPAEPPIPADHSALHRD